MKRTISVLALVSAVAVLLAAEPLTLAAVWVGGMCLAFVTGRGEQILLTAIIMSAALVAVHTLLFVWALCREWRRSAALRRWLMPVRASPWPGNLASAAAQLGLSGRLDLIESPEVNAFCYGLINPRICITTGMVRRLNRGQLSAVLLHERQHARQFDPLRLAVAHGFRTSLFYIRLVPVIAQRYAERRELQADDAAVLHLGSTRPLAAALVRVLLQPEPAAAQYSGAAISGFSAAAARVDRLMNETRELDPLLGRREFSELFLSAGALAIVVLAGAYSVTAVLASHLCA
ncbi:MAG TPA: M56 family metallopeptidase [Dehalococcoidia bacterium]|nr:M56 family metallopeptidase [Dehalococcoidia bacterium]